MQLFILNFIPNFSQKVFTIITIYVLERRGFKMGYCFLRFEKLKTVTNIKAVQAHNLREKEVLNADSGLYHMNDEMVSLNGKTLMEAWQERMKELEPYAAAKKTRKDAVKLLEFVTTFSREDRDKIDIEKWKEDNKRWLEENLNANKEKYGNNILSMVFHADEPGNVHIHTVIVPIDDKGHLNASYYIGKRNQLIQMQTSYAKSMQEHGLKRGLEHSRARHEDLNKFYAQINQAVNPEIPKYLPEDTIESYTKKVEEKMQEYGLKIVELQYDKKRNLETLITKIKELEYAIEQKNKELQQKEIQLQKAKDRQADFEREFGEEKTVKNKIQLLNDLNFALRNYDDEEYCKTVNQAMINLSKWGRKRKKELEQRERELQKTKNR